MSGQVLRPAVLRPSGHTKTLATRRGSLRFSVAGASVASVPPRPSVLPPGAGNKEEPKKVLKAGNERAERFDEEAAVGLEVTQGDADAPAVGRHDDGDAVAVAALGEVQASALQIQPVLRRVRGV